MPPSSLPKVNGTHVFKRRGTSSSCRVVAAAHASSVAKQSMSKRARERASRVAKAKYNDRIKPWHELLKRGQGKGKILFKKGERIVIDGGAGCTLAQLDGATVYPVERFHIPKHHLKDTSRGLYLGKMNEVTFQLLPRETLIQEKIISDPKARELRKIFGEIMDEANPTIRGKSKRCYPDVSAKLRYSCMGNQVSMGEKGIRIYSKEYNWIEKKEWDAVYKLVLDLEGLSRRFLPHAAISKCYHARAIVNYPTIQPAETEIDEEGNAGEEEGQDHSESKRAHMTGSVAFGENTYVAVHTDEDFLHSCLMILSEDELTLDMEVVVYFVFPTLGFAIPLRPGDVLIFDSTVPHCLSSRCNYSDKIIGMATYLKSRSVGLNDNSEALNEKQKGIIDKIEEINEEGSD